MIPSDKYQRPDLIAAQQAAKPLLFDLDVDPHEEDKIASNYPETVAALRSRLDAHWKP